MTSKVGVWIYGVGTVVGKGGARRMVVIRQINLKGRKHRGEETEQPISTNLRKTCQSMVGEVR